MIAVDAVAHEQHGETLRKGPAAVLTMLPGTALCAGLAHAIDSSHGSAIVTPTPRRTVRLEIVPFVIVYSIGRRYRRAESSSPARLFRNCGLVTMLSIRLSNRMRILYELGAHAVDGNIVGQHQTAPERVRQQLARQIVDEVVLAAGAHVGAQALDAGSVAPPGNVAEASTARPLRSFDRRSPTGRSLRTRGRASRIASGSSRTPGPRDASRAGRAAADRASPRRAAIRAPRPAAAECARRALS